MSLRHLLCTILAHVVHGALKKDQFKISEAGKKQVFLYKLNTVSEPKPHIIPTVVGQCRTSLLGSPWEFLFFSPALVALLTQTYSSSIGVFFNPS